MTAAVPEPAGLPSGLRDRVLAASRQARAAGRPVHDAPLIAAAEAYRRAADALASVLCRLDDDDWRRPVLRGLDAQGLVGHLIGVEDDVHRALSGDPGVADADHIESTQPAAISQAGRSPADTYADWRRAADRTLELIPSAPDGVTVAMHGMRLTLDALLLVRTFELWTHENDIQRAVGREPSAPDAATLRLMTDLGAQLLPYAATRAGLAEPVQLRLVLTGPGGGTWDVTLGPDTPSPAAVSIVADAVGFCRLVANRIRPGDLDLHVIGDSRHVAPVLAAARTLALD